MLPKADSAITDGLCSGHKTVDGCCKTLAADSAISDGLYSGPQNRGRMPKDARRVVLCAFKPGEGNMPKESS